MIRWQPALRGLIRRRLLVNWTADPEVVSRLLPSPFRPKLFRGDAVVGVCLIRLESLRPSRLPAVLGLSSENAAHRIAVTWADPATGEPREGVYVARRDSGSRLNRIVGGTLFPGVHHAARFDVLDRDDRLSIEIRSKDGAIDVGVRGRVADALPADSRFASLEDASRFFEGGRVGWSPNGRSGGLDGIELIVDDWSVKPFATEEARSSFYEDAQRFPRGSVRFDHALLMRDVSHRWQSIESPPTASTT